MVVIVTDRLYIVSQRIISMYVEEHLEEQVFRKRKYLIPVTKIHVQFEPYTANANTNNRNENYGVEVSVYGRRKAIALFKDMVRQIREQCPDHLYLNQVAESFLAGEIENDASAEEICLPGEEERRSKKVLRRPKKRKRGSR